MNAWLAMLCLCGIYDDSAPKYEPTATYEMMAIEGFSILASKTLDDHPAERAAALDELKSQLQRIEKVVPAGPLTALKQVKIWLEWEIKPGGAAEFHPSADWLKANGYNPEKASAIEISNARNFVKWSHQAQPWMVLHELAHAYHFRVLGADHAGIRKAYQSAMDEHKYDKVAFVTGGERKGYATTDRMEYFAELSEAYFGKNDFFPFTREELKTHDPEGFAVMNEAWERPAT